MKNANYEMVKGAAEFSVTREDKEEGGIEITVTGKIEKLALRSEERHTISPADGVSVEDAVAAAIEHFKVLTIDAFGRYIEETVARFSEFLVEGAEE